MSAPLIAVPIPVESRAVRIDSSCLIHPFYIHKMDSGPVRLMTIAHAFNYRVAVLRDGVRSAVRVGRSRKTETCFLKDVNISWGQQVTVMFQVVSTLMEEVPAFALRMRELQGESPNVQLKDNPWGHVEHCDANCTCLQSDRTGAYVHCLLPMPGRSDSTSLNDAEVSVEVENGFRHAFRHTTYSVEDHAPPEGGLGVPLNHPASWSGLVLQHRPGFWK